MVPGGSGSGQLGSRLLTQYRSQSLTAARKSSRGSRKVHRALATRAEKPMTGEQLPPSPPGSLSARAGLAAGRLLYPSQVAAHPYLGPIN